MNVLNFNFESANRLSIFIGVLACVFKEDNDQKIIENCKSNLNFELQSSNLKHLISCDGYNNFGNGPSTISIKTDDAISLISVLKKFLLDNEITKNFSWRETAIQDMNALERMI